MPYTTRYNIAKIVLLSGLLLCTINFGYICNQFFLDDVITITFIDSEQEEIPENDTEDRSDTTESEVEKDKVLSTIYYIGFNDFVSKSNTNRQVLDFFRTIHLEQYTPPPEFS